MFIEKLELFGFKSFAARTEVPFARGITAIVGPNGCGKSNISDSFRWVMGEQSARALRGERIQDVIFKGSGAAKALGMAEVVLTVRNDDGTLPLEYTQVAIARRIFRSGESEFSINKVPCRLKDIRDLFAGTGMGSHGYSVIERNQVDAVLSEKDESRRFLFEEAAGITKYKQRRKESERRLEGVEQDLTRIEDMIREIERGVRSLARQAGKVRRWRRFKEELDHHEVRLAWEQWHELADRSTSSENLHRQRESERSSAAATLSILETRRETQRLELLERATRLEDTQRAADLAERAVTSAREEIRVLGARVDSWTGEEGDLRGRLERARARRVQLAEEIAGLAPRLDEMRAGLLDMEQASNEAAGRRTEADLELRETRARLAQAQQLTLDLSTSNSGRQRDLEGKRERRLAVSRRQAGLESHLEAFAAREAQVAADLEACEEALAAHERERDELLAVRDARQYELSGVREQRAALGRELGEVDRLRASVGSRLAVLQEQKERHEGFDAAVRRLLEDRASFDGLIGVVGEEVRLRSDAEVAGRAVLGDRVPWVLVRDEEAAIGIMGRLRELGLGGITFFPMREAGVDPDRPDAGCDRAVLDLFEDNPATRPFVGRLAAETILAGSLEEARGLAAAQGRRAVSPEGDAVEAGRVFRLAGGESAVAEILRREVEIPRLQGELADAEVRRNGLVEAEAGAARRADELEGQIREGETRLRGLDEERSKAAASRTGLRTELAMLGEERIRLQNERETLIAESGQLDEEIARLGDQVAQSAEDAGRARTDFEALSRRAEEQERVRDERTREASRLEIEVVRRRGELGGEENRWTAMERERAEVVRSIEETEERLEERSREAADASRRAADLSTGLDALGQAAQAAAEAFQLARAGHQECQDAVFSLDAEIRTARERVDDLVQVLHAEDVERVQTRSHADRIRERVREDYGIDLESYSPPPDPAPAKPRTRRVARPAETAGGVAGAAAGGAEDAGQPAAGTGDGAQEGDGAGADAGVDGGAGRDADAGVDGDRDGALETDADLDGDFEGELDEDLDGALEAGADADGMSGTLEEAADGDGAGAGRAPFTYTRESRQARIADLRHALQQMGNLNYLAEEEYRAARERFEFHTRQATDLRQAREDLLEAIRRINETAGVMFEETFSTVQEHFKSTFDRLFPGGEASLSLQGGDPLEGEIEIAARPRGKKLESIRLLSSGERALTAIALLFALYLAKPSPVCLLDEVDAPLDDANLERFLLLVRHFSERTQFICITHNKKTMETADRLFGVTMEEPGISKIVSVRLDNTGADVFDPAPPAAPPAGAVGFEAGDGAGGSA